MADLANKIRECPFCKEEIKTSATRCMHCHADIPPGPDGRKRLPMIQGRRIRALAHRVSGAATFANEGPSSACNDLEIDDEGIWEYIGEDDDNCYYWGPS